MGRHLRWYSEVAHSQKKYIMTVTTQWKEGLQFEATQEPAGSVLMDGDVKKGISPKALLLAGLAGCSAVDVVDILTKMRVPFTALSVVSSAEQTQDHPRVFTDIDLLYRIATDGGNEEKVKKAIDLSLEKYCGVAAMLRKNSAIRYRLECVQHA
ncbi:MAG: OsmC family peroxiredoxin [Chitinophagales bacterium]|nr:OsmC family peroxiredoxin [Chitinophagales bacterium]